MDMDITVASMMNPYPVLDGNGNVRVNNDHSPYMTDLREMYTQRMQMEREQLRNRLVFEMSAISDMVNLEEEQQKKYIEKQNQKIRMEQEEQAKEEQAKEEQNEKEEVIEELDIKPIPISYPITDTLTPIMPLTKTISHPSIGQKQIGNERNDSSWGNRLRLVSYMLASIGVAYVGATLRMDFMM